MQIKILLLFFIYNVFGQQMPGWKLTLEENVREYDMNEHKCDSGNCREWMDIKNIAYCKAHKMYEIIKGKFPDHNYGMYYTETSFKSQTEQGWSKFIFNIENDDKFESRVHLLKICVPTSKSNYAWVSPFCPRDKCSEEIDSLKTKCEITPEAVAPSFLQVKTKKYVRQRLNTTAIKEKCNK